METSLKGYNLVFEKNIVVTIMQDFNVVKKDNSI